MERSVVPATVIVLGKDESSIMVSTRESLRAKRISIRISTKGVELVLPLGSNFNKANKFLLSKEGWIRAKLNKRQTNREIPANVNQIHILGRLYNIVRVRDSPNELIKIEGDAILISERISTRVALETFLKATIRSEITECAARLSALLKLTYNKINIRDTKSQWGSCAHNGNLSFSWRLIFAPKFVLEYVVAHEICHLIERNHGPKFWKLVAQLDPKYRSAKLWLKKNGDALHRY